MTTPAPAEALGQLPAGRYQLDQAASAVRIAHRTMWGLVTVKGSFGQVSGAAVIPADGSPATGSLTIAAASLDTGHAKRDEHLRSGDFFAVEQHAELSYTASEARAQADGTVAVTGTLTVRGVTEPLALTATARPTGPDSVELTASTTVDRDRFGLGWNKMGMIKGLTTVTVTAAFRLEQ